MTIDEMPSGPAPLSPERKADVLLTSDLAMMAGAGRYNLAEREERRRSVRDLAELFFHLAAILSVDLFVEAGAKDAGSARRAVRLLQPSRTVAFEANPFTYRRFRHLNDGVEGLTYEHLALTTAPGTVTFHVRRGPDGAARPDGQASLLRRPDEPDPVAVQVDATSLDAYLGTSGYQRPALWVDVEGASGPVLQGGRALLDRAVVVIIEVEDRLRWDGQWLRPQVLSYLYDRGLVPAARDFQSRYQYNVVLVRHDLIDTVDRVRWALTLFHSAARGYAGRSVPGPRQPVRSRLRRLVSRLRS